MRRRTFIMTTIGATVAATLPHVSPESYWCDCGLVQYCRQPEGHFAATDFAGKRLTYAMHRRHLNLHREPLPKSAEERFNESLYERLKEKAKQGYKMDFMLIDPPMNLGTARYRYVRFWVKGQEEPFMWYHPYPH